MEIRRFPFFCYLQTEYFIQLIAAFFNGLLVADDTDIIPVTNLFQQFN